MAKMVWVAMMESESKSWVAVAETEDRAKESILDKWNEHQEVLAKRGWDTYIYENVDDLDEYYGIDTVRIPMGFCEMMW